MAPACARAPRAGQARRLHPARHRVVAVASAVRKRQAFLAGLETTPRMLMSSAVTPEEGSRQTRPARSQPTRLLLLVCAAVLGVVLGAVGCSCTPPFTD